MSPEPVNLIGGILMLCDPRDIDGACELRRSPWTHECRIHPGGAWHMCQRFGRVLILCHGITPGGYVVCYAYRARMADLRRRRPLA